MSKVKRLLVTTLEKDGNDQILPVNTGIPVHVKSEIGEFAVSVYIKDFDGCRQHGANSVKNVGDKWYLDGNQVQDAKPFSVNNHPNLRLLVNFTPKSDIKGTELIFGNDCPTPVRDYIPTTLLSTGIRFFSWFINPTITQDIYCDEPYLYGLALNSFTKIASGPIDLESFLNNPEEDLDHTLDIPKQPQDRRKYFCKIVNASKFTFRENKEYLFVFDTNFISIGNSEYSVAIPTYKDRTFNIDVLRYANENLDNFNWTVKQTQLENSGVKSGKIGFNLNFKLVDEQ